jgi:hypothetical protein
MQSTYNSLSGLSALSIACKGYNSTYVSKGFAFENALDDALMQLNENPSQSFLVGTYDEADITQYNTHTRIGFFKKEFITTDKLAESKTSGTVQGEAAVFFCISGEPSSNSWCRVQDVGMVYKPSETEFQEALDNFLRRNEISAEEIDILISGISGDFQRDTTLRSVTTRSFFKTPRLHFKQFCGELCTATSFAVWLGASILKKQIVPEQVANSSSLKSSQSNILIINHYMDSNYSLILLKK